MALYRYGQASLISEIRVHKDDAGREARALLYAAPDADAKVLVATVAALKARGWQAIPLTDDQGRPALEVRAFGRSKRLVTELQSAGALRGEPQKQATADDKLSLKKRFAALTLWISGLFYVVGDWGFFQYGRQDANKPTMRAAVAYFMGTLALVFFGSSDRSPRQIRDADMDIQHFLAKDGTLPENRLVLSLKQQEQRSPWQKFVDFCKRYPVEVHGATLAVAGGFIVQSVQHKLNVEQPEELAFYKAALDRGLTGIDKQFATEQVEKTIPRDRRAHQMDIGLGSLTAASAITTMLIKEKAKDPEAVKRGGIAGAWNYLREHPTKIAGYGYLVSTLCHAGSTYIEMRTSKHVIDTYADANFSDPEIRKKALGTKAVDGTKGAVESARETRGALKQRALFVLANLASEILISISSKGHGEGVKSNTDVDTSVAAQGAKYLYLYADPDERDVKVENLAGYLANPNVLGGKSSELADRIRTQLSGLRDNPWAASFALDMPKEKSGASNNTSQPVLEPATRKTTPPSMQKRSAWSKPGERSRQESGWAPQVENEAELAPAR